MDIGGNFLVEGGDDDGGVDEDVNKVSGCNIVLVSKM